MHGLCVFVRVTQCVITSSASSAAVLDCNVTVLQSCSSRSGLV